MTRTENDQARYDSTRRVWEDIWDEASVEVELEAVQYARSMETIQAYLPYLVKDEPILEAGSGLSAVVITLRRMGYQVMGMDYATNALERSHAYDPSLPLFAGDVHALPCADNSVAGYLSFGVLEHFEQGMEPALREAYRVIRPGGTLVLTIPYPNIIHRLIEWRRTQRNESRLNNDEFYESTYTREALISAVMNTGFDLQDIQPTSHAFTLWGLGGIFRKPGYYQTSAFAEGLGGVLAKVMPWAFNFTTLVIATKPVR
jgi:ubiquinone/menaquinone biosynthesis C-methylase UbiE